MAFALSVERALVIFIAGCIVVLCFVCAYLSLGADDRDRERNGCAIRLLARRHVYDIDTALWVCETERREAYFDAFEQMIGGE